MECLLVHMYIANLLKNLAIAGHVVIVMKCYFVWQGCTSNVCSTELRLLAMGGHCDFAIRVAD